MRFAYTRRGGPLLNWNGPSPPHQTRAGETRSLGEFYPTTRSSGAVRRYGGRLALPNGAAIPYEHNRQLGALDIPLPGAPEIIADYEAPQPGAAIVHLGHNCSMQGYMPEGAARAYGQTMLAADAPQPSLLSSPLIRKGAALAAAYHGVKRNNGSVLWGLVWGLAAYVSPFNGMLVPAIGVAQGFAQPKVKSNPSFRVRVRKKDSGWRLLPKNRKKRVRIKGRKKRRFGKR